MCVVASPTACHAGCLWRAFRHSCCALCPLQDSGKGRQKLQRATGNGFSMLRQRSQIVASLAAALRELCRCGCRCRWRNSWSWHLKQAEHAVNRLRAFLMRPPRPAAHQISMQKLPVVCRVLPHCAPISMLYNNCRRLK